MAGVDDLGITFHEPVEMTSIGPDQGRFTEQVDMKSHFGVAHGPGYTPVSPAMQAQMGMTQDNQIEVKPDAPAVNANVDLWAGTVVQQDPLIAQVQNVSYNMDNVAMQGAQLGDGPGRMANEIGMAVNEIFGAMTPDTPDPQDFQMQASLKMPTPQPGLL